jgi:hypothetical protein
MKFPAIDTLDLAFPTLVRYIGLITTLVLIGFSLAGHIQETAPGFVAAAGMILYKTVHEASKDKSHSKQEEDDKRELSS